MYHRHEKTSVRYSFASLGEVGEFMSRPKTWKGANEAEDPYNTSQDWDLNAGYAACVRMASLGWLEGAEKAQKALKAFEPKSPAPDTRTDFYGYRPHVPRFCAGAPDSMIRRADSDATDGMRRVLSLVVQVNALGHVSAKYMSNFGVAVTQYINQLETDGTRVELSAVIVSQVGSVRLAHTVMLKSADQPLDLAVTAFAIGHPGMFRRIGFGLRERSSAPYMGYGSTVPARMSDLIEPAPGTVILQGMHEADIHARTPEAALAYVTRMIDRAIQTQNAEAL
jgi:hypothetical protein